MALRFSVEANKTQLKSINRKLAELEKFSKKEVKSALRHAAANAVGRMKQDAPVDTGRLRRNIEYTVTNRGVNIVSEAIDPETGQDYAPVQEYGLRFLPAQPYFRPNITKFIEELNRNLRRRLQQILRK